MIIQATSEQTHRRGAIGLLIVILLAFGLRAIALWFTRPEFMGWFNHATWYWVQTRGLIAEGALPFADLPLLFYLYAGLARILEGFGQAPDAAIIHASRAVMSLAGALVAVPCWAVLRRMNAPSGLRGLDWALVVCAAFLPLTFTHLPELLQKNMLALVFLAGLMHSSYRALDKRLWIAVAAVWFTLIALTHLGTLFAAGLWLGAMGLALVAERPTLSTVALTLGGGIAAALLAGLALAYFDPAAMQRALAFGSATLSGSLIAGVFTDVPGIGRAAALLGALIPLALALLGLRLYWHRRPSLPRHDRIFWLANLIFAWLLVLPVIDLAVLPRMILFLPLPLLFLLALARRYSDRPRLIRALTLAGTAGILLLLVGETQNLVRGSAQRSATHAELLALKTKYDFSKRDFIIAPYAIAPTLNWFLNSHAGLITALQREDFDRYDRVFVLNTGREQQRNADDGYTLSDDLERYQAMRGPVPVPAPLEPDRDFDNFYFYRLFEVPEGWEFDNANRWSGVSAQDDS